MLLFELNTLRKHGLNIQYHAIQSMATMHNYASPIDLPFKKHYFFIPSATCKRGGARRVFPRVNFEARKERQCSRLLYPEKRFPKVNNITGKKRFNAG